MPQISDRFGPLQYQVTLDASGNGTISWQPNGKNARVTNLFVKVTTVVLQATCTVYLGQISDGRAINLTNSGSTGAAASGQIDIQDGETLYVVWRGGDVGAVATVTLVGVALPFDQVGASHLDWADPIAAGDGSLIYPAVKSPNFSTGVAGWRIERNGNVEFNNAVIRGSLIAGGGNVVIDSNGVDVHSIPIDTRYRINTSGGFIASRNSGDDGRYAKVTVETGSIGGGIFSGQPKDPLPNGASMDNDGILWFGADTTGASDAPFFDLQTPTVTGKSRAGIKGTAQSSGSAVNNSDIELDATTVSIFRDNLVDSFSHQYARGENGAFLASFGPANSATFVVNFTNAFSGAPIVTTNIASSAGAVSRWISRAYGATTTSFTFWVQSADGGNSTFSNVRLEWQATEFTP